MTATPDNGYCNGPRFRSCGCGEEAVVGIGNPPTWVCLDCFNKALAETREIIDKVKEAVHGPF